MMIIGQRNNQSIRANKLTYRHNGEKEGQNLIVDVYLKWNKKELFDRYRLNWCKERIDRLYNILYLYQKENIIENFYMYRISEEIVK